MSAYTKARIKLVGGRVIRSFFLGFGSVVDLAGTGRRRRVIIEDIRLRRAEELLADDWRAVGEDMLSAMNEYSVPEPSASAHR